MKETNITLDMNLFTDYASKKLEYTAKAMPKGELWNRHNSGYADKCDGIVMLMDGTVCAAYFPMSCLNPVDILENGKEIQDPATGKTFTAALSTWAHGGNIIWKGDWEKTVAAYNKGCWPSKSIVAYYAFRCLVIHPSGSPPALKETFSLQREKVSFCLKIVKFGGKFL